MEIKKELFWGLGIAFVVVVLSIYFILSSKQPIKKQVNTTPTTSLLEVLTAEEVAKHNLESDCWFIVDNKVYNVTSYISEHPRGVQLMVPYCGKDASEAYKTKDGEETHSQKANDDLATLYIGDIGRQKVK